MKITAITPQVSKQNRVNIFVDKKYRFSLDVYQLQDLNIKVGSEIDEAEILIFETESLYGKLYARAQDYCLTRLHSKKEVFDYLYRKLRGINVSDKKDSQSIDVDLINRIINRLIEKKYLDDLVFAKNWVDNRMLKKGISRRKLIQELHKKGISNDIVEAVLVDNVRNDKEEILKIISKKRARYSDDKKLVAYLSRQGFSYTDIKDSIKTDFDEADY